MHLDADDIAVAHKHFVLVQDVQVDVEAFQAVRQITHMPLTCSWCSKMKRCSSCLFHVWSAVMAGLLLLASRKIPKRRHLCRPPSLSRITPSDKKTPALCTPSPPQLCLRFVLHIKCIVCVCVTNTKQNDTLLEKQIGNSKSLCGSSSQYIHRQ